MKGEPAAPTPAVPPAAEVALSKNQLRKLRKSAKWESERELRKQKRRDNKVKRRERRQAASSSSTAAGGPDEEGAKEDGEGTDGGRKRRRVLTALDDPNLAPPEVTVVLDCSFDNLMGEKDIASLSRQIQNTYAANRRTTKPFNIAVTSFGGNLKARFDAFLQNSARWKLITFDERSFKDIYPRERIVYLSSEATEVLHQVRPDDIYIIGGLVDHNQHKGLCYRLAQEMGIRSVQLPIGEHLKLATRKVLAVNHVFEILAKVYENGGDWQSAMLAVMPPRKGATALPTASTSAEASSSSATAPETAAHDDAHDDASDDDDEEQQQQEGDQDDEGEDEEDDGDGEDEE